jgi:hypothetical protein
MLSRAVFEPEARVVITAHRTKARLIKNIGAFADVAAFWYVAAFMPAPLPG